MDLSSLPFGRSLAMGLLALFLCLPMVWYLYDFHRAVFESFSVPMLIIFALSVTVPLASVTAFLLIVATLPDANENGYMALLRAACAFNSVPFYLVSLVSFCGADFSPAGSIKFVSVCIVAIWFILLIDLIRTTSKAKG